MEFVPKYTVSYHGEWCEAGVPFDIDPADAEEMKEHGEVVDDPTPPDIPEEPPVEDKPRRGRRRKANDEPGADEVTDG